ncbi:MAG: C1 family peptidase [Scytolyngbya sp. HA4215-MV1]|jgi:C1A family cysteine protease|nr:C1 family peptidase [Scytolyngbya sp. HA4215-MV1]
MLAQNRKYRIGGYQAGRRPESAKHHSAGRFQKDQLPPKVDLRQYMTTVEEQVGNSCVANAFVGAYEYLAKRNLGDSGDVSRLFVYYNARAQMDAVNEDSGTQMYCAIESLIAYGACCEDLWPNDENLISQEPHADAYEQAANFKIMESECVETDLNLWRHTLAEGYPIAFALNTFESFDEATHNRGRVPLPKKSDNVRETHGWHAMLCVGYSDKDRMFIVRNSWGSAWGDQGYCYIPYDYVIHPDYNAHDSWIVKSLSDMDFSAEVWEEDESFFADEGSLLLYSFYVRTKDPEGFVEALDTLCKNYVESEEDYYFDYEEEEEDGDVYTVTILNFDLTIDESDEFLAELDTLCQHYAIDADYAFNQDDDPEEADSDEAENDEEEAEPVDEDEESEDESVEEEEGEGEEEGGEEEEALEAEDEEFEGDYEEEEYGEEIEEEGEEAEEDEE